MSIPRETLRWILSLDLSYPVKNVRRDFANGFLMAEILSRYYPGDVQMHSFENVASSTRKKQNWHLLEKLFKKKQIPVERSQIEAVMAAEGDAAVDMVQQLHEFIHSPAFQASQEASQSTDPQRQPGVPSYQPYAHEPRSGYANPDPAKADGHPPMQAQAAMYIPAQPQSTGPAFSSAPYPQQPRQPGGIIPQYSTPMQTGPHANQAHGRPGGKQPLVQHAATHSQSANTYGAPAGMQQHVGEQQYSMQQPDMGMQYAMQQGYGYPPGWAPMPPMQYAQQGPGAMHSASQLQGYSGAGSVGPAGYGGSPAGQRQAPAVAAGAARPAAKGSPAAAAKPNGPRVATDHQAASRQAGGSYASQQPASYAQGGQGYAGQQPAGYAANNGSYTSPPAASHSYVSPIAANGSTGHASPPAAYGGYAGQPDPHDGYAAQPQAQYSYQQAQSQPQSQSQYGYQQAEDGYANRRNDGPAAAGGTSSADIPFSKARPVDYQPYDIKDFEDKAYNVKRAGGNYWQLGRLGPDLETEELQAKREKAERVKALAAQVREDNLKKAAVSAGKPRKEAAKEPTLREKAMQFAKNIPKPESSPAPDTSPASSGPGSGAGRLPGSAGSAGSAATKGGGAKAVGAEAARARAAGVLATPPSALQLLEAQHAEDTRKVDAIRAQLQRMM